MSKENPTSFEDVDVVELRKSAIEDFACDLKADANKKTVEAALLEDGITWEQYAELKGLTPEPAPVLEAAPEVETADAEVPNLADFEIITAEPPAKTQKYLVRMERNNVRYDTRGYKFTQEHPYALVDPRDIDYVLESEIGFRMATPRELEEFYS